MTDFQYLMNEPERKATNNVNRPARPKGSNDGRSGATRRSRRRARDFRALNPEMERLVSALEAAGAIKDGNGELHAQVVTCLALYLREPIDELAAVIELGILEPAIAANMGWHVGNRKAAWDELPPWDERLRSS